MATRAAASIAAVLLLTAIPAGSLNAARRIEGKARFRPAGSVELSKKGGLGRIAVHGKIGAVLEREEGVVTLFDLSKAAKPRALGSYDGALEGGRAGASLDGDLAFSDDGKWLFYARQSTQLSADGLHVIDVTDPKQPVLAFYQPEGGTSRLAYYRSGESAYVVTLDAIHGIVVNRFDDTTGAAVPVWVDPLPALKVGGPASAGIWIDRKDPATGSPLMYVTTGKTGLQIYDLSLPEAPELRGSWDGAGLAEVEVVATKKKRTVYAATEYWFDATLMPQVVELDATKLGDIEQRRTLSFAYTAADQYRVQGMTRFRGSLFLAHSRAGLRAFDGSGAPMTEQLHGGGKPNEMTALMGGPYAFDVVAARGYLYLSDAATGRLTAVRVTR